MNHELIGQPGCRGDVVKIPGVSRLFLFQPTNPMNPTNAVNPTGSTILIVEDDKNIRDQLYWALSDGYQVILSEDGSDVSRIVQDIRPNLILLDLHLPPHIETPDKGLNILSTLMEGDGDIKVIVLRKQPKQSCLKGSSHGGL